MRKIRVICSLFFVLLVSCSQDKASKWQTMYAEKMNCPDGAGAEIERWGKVGDMSVSCKLQHGKFTGWKNGKKILEGNYHYGKQVGTWTWFDEEGNLTKTIEYVDGKEMSSSLVEKK